MTGLSSSRELKDISILYSGQFAKDKRERDAGLLAARRRCFRPVVCFRSQHCGVVIHRCAGRNIFPAPATGRTLHHGNGSKPYTGARSEALSYRRAPWICIKVAPWAIRRSLAPSDKSSRCSQDTCRPSGGYLHIKMNNLSFRSCLTVIAERYKYLGAARLRTARASYSESVGQGSAARNLKA